MVHIHSNCSHRIIIRFFTESSITSPISVNLQLEEPLREITTHSIIFYSDRDALHFLTVPVSPSETNSEVKSGNNKIVKHTHTKQHSIVFGAVKVNQLVPPRDSQTYLRL